MTLLGDLHDLGIGFVSLGEGIDLGTPAGRLQLHIGRPTQAPPVEKLAAVADLSIRDAARKLRVSRSTVQRWRAQAGSQSD